MTSFPSHASHAKHAKHKITAGNEPHSSNNKKPRTEPNNKASSSSGFVDILLPIPTTDAVQHAMAAMRHAQDSLRRALDTVKQSPPSHETLTAAHAQIAALQGRSKALQHEAACFSHLCRMLHDETERRLDAMTKDLRQRRPRFSEQAPTTPQRRMGRLEPIEVQLVMQFLPLEDIVRLVRSHRFARDALVPTPAVGEEFAFRYCEPVAIHYPQTRNLSSLERRCRVAVIVQTFYNRVLGENHLDAFLEYASNQKLHVSNLSLVIAGPYHLGAVQKLIRHPSMHRLCELDINGVRDVETVACEQAAFRILLGPYPPVDAEALIPTTFLNKKQQQRAAEDNMRDVQTFDRRYLEAPQDDKSTIANGLRPYGLIRRPISQGAPIWWKRRADGTCENCTYADVQQYRHTDKWDKRVLYLIRWKKKHAFPW
jgi:hypothetical protein